MSGGDDVLGGHQCTATELKPSRADQSHHPGVLVGLREAAGEIEETGETLTGDTSVPPTILVTASTPQRHPGNTVLGYSSATLLVERKKGKREDIALLYFEMKIVLSNHFISVTFNCI